MEGAMKTEHFHSFLVDFNPPNNGKKNVVIMDNLPVHHATKSCIKLGLSTIAELLASKNIEPIYLPSYTPELNPVEKKNNIMKGDVKKAEARTKERLMSVIEERVKFFQKEDLTKYLDNSVKECLMKLNATSPTENNKFFWNTERWNNMCQGARYLSIITRTFVLQNTQFL
jgi:transposase